MHKIIDSLTSLIKTLNGATPNALLGLALFVLLVAIWVLGRR